MCAKAPRPRQKVIFVIVNLDSNKSLNQGKNMRPTWGRRCREGKERSKANLNIWPRGVDLTKDVGEMWRRELHHPSHSKTAQILS